jgi:hypothetical protein
MVDWFSRLAAGSELPTDAASGLQERGFVVLPGLVRSGRMERLDHASFIPRDRRAGTDFAARMPPETRARLGPLARYVLAL